jgi:hypothetical protein
MVQELNGSIEIVNKRPCCTTFELVVPVEIKEHYNGRILQNEEIVRSQS